MISVCMATFNGGQFVRKQIASILSQLSSSDELVISDDGSTDDTLDVIASFNDKRIKLFRHEVEHGYTSNFENAIIHSSGEFIFLSDQDDIWCSNKVSVMMGALETCDFVVSDACLIDADDNVTEESYFKLRKPSTSVIGNYIRFAYLGCMMAFRRSLLSKALPFPKDRKLCTHDNWLFCVGSTYYKYKVLPDVLFMYRRHGMNASGGGLVNTTSFVMKLNYRLYVLANLIVRTFKC